MSDSPSARTTVVGVIGDPIRHSLSPPLYNSAFRALGIDWVAVAFHVAPSDLAQALDGVRALGLGGLAVTMPHKEPAASLVSRVSSTVERLGALNCIRVVDGSLVGENTDGVGFLESLRRGTGVDPAGRHALVVGTGGAARAVVLALDDAGASEVTVVGRDASRAGRAASLAPRVGRVGSAADASDSEIVVNATPVGMAGTSVAGTLPPLDPALLHAGQIAVDLIYHPRPTRWLELAASNGATTLGGLGMLVHQAARNLTLWTGCEPPVDVMWRAADRSFQAGGPVGRASDESARVAPSGA